VIDSTATLENLPGYVLSGLHYLRFLLEADLPNLMMRCQTIKLYFPKTAPTTPQRPPVMLGTAATTADTWREVMSNA
jgi:hypothetical protein